MDHTDGPGKESGHEAALAEHMLQLLTMVDDLTRLAPTPRRTEVLKQIFEITSVTGALGLEDA